MDDLVCKIESLRPITAVVVGDFMLDEFQYGDAERLSADAPVPVLRVRSTDRSPGGAANVCLDLVALRATVRAIGVVGDDEAGGTLTGALADEGIDTTGLVVDRDRPTTRKLNLIGLAQQRHPQKMFRVDFESCDTVSCEIERALLEAFSRALHGADVVCIEDYAKGVCSESICRGVIERARAAGVPVLVDPAMIDDFARYAGATAITPNRREGERATGLATDETGSIGANGAITARLLDDLDLEAVVLTLDRHGALLHERGGRPEAISTTARAVYDVTGAGDMMLAALAVTHGAGLCWHDAVRFANAAAGLEVEVFGVEAIPFDRVVHQLVVESARPGGPLRSLDELAVEVRARQSRGERVVLTNGCFDVLHAGHVHLLDRARALGDFLIVATNTDETITRFKGPTRPVNALADRAVVLAGLAAVDAVVAFGEDTPVELIERLGPDVLAKGDEYTIEQIPGAALVLASGGRVERIEMLAGHSSTGVLGRLGDGRAATTSDAATEARFTADRSAPGGRGDG